MKRFLSHAVPLALCLALGACGGGSSGSSSTTTLTVPGAPTIGTATAGDGSASIAFTAPSSTGGASITAYTATCSATGQTTVTGTGTSSPISVSGMTNATAYTCSVTATNSVGTSAASGTVSVTPSSSSSSAAVSTASVLCPYSINQSQTMGNGDTFQSTASWTCSGTTRSLTGDGIPNHATGNFPSPANPNTISVQTISATFTTAPALTSTVTQVLDPGYALNSVKMEPGTAGTCASTITSASQCELGGGTGTWRVEALTEPSTFDFGADFNNAHVQPTGQYHYHGMPVSLLTNAGNTGQTMTLVGWGTDGFPIYARYAYSTATDASSAIKVMTGSYALITTIPSDRPSVSIAPLGSFMSDWTYVAGSGDLDECNGRYGVTPEFPDGIYYYMITDTYPFIGRCVKGTPSSAAGPTR